MINRLRTLLNACRNLVVLKGRYPWIRYGRNVHCHLCCRFVSRDRDITIGNDVGIGYRCVVVCNTQIGNKVLIAGNVALLNANEHRCDVVGMAIFDSGHGSDHRIVIEDDVWIGHGALLLAPLHVGRGAVIGAGSVVTRDVAPYSCVAGNPARQLRMRFTPEQIAAHEAKMDNP